jgi:putative ABC transport system permease protein
MLQDLRFSLRSLLQAKAFAAAAVLTLGLGIGATTVVYSVVDALLLRPLPFGDRGARLVTIHSTHPTETAQTQLDDAGVSYADLMDFRESAGALEAVEAVAARNVSLASNTDTERVRAASVTTGFFGMLGTAPALGRDFEAADGAAPGLEQVAIISDGLWRRLFAGAPDIAGRSILVNGRALTIVGVMPPRFDFPEGQQLWLPLRQERDADRGRRGLMAVGLMRRGVTLEQTRGELQTAAAGLAAEHPGTNRAWSAHAMPLRDYFVAPTTRAAAASMVAAVALVLLVACANIAGLLVARGLGRGRELAVRAALGGSRSALARLLIAEALILAVAGGVVGVLAAAWGLRGLLASMADPMPLWAAPAIDGRVLLFAAACAAASALLSGLLPAWRLSKITAAGALASGARATGGAPGQRRVQGVLVAAQVAASLTLVITATMLSLSITRLARADAGFDPSPLASLRFYIPGDQYDDPARRAQAVARVVDRLASLPGVRAAAATGSIPADDGAAIVRVEPPGRVDAGEGIGVSIIPVTSGFWTAMGLTLAEGRTFTASESLDPESGAVIVGRGLAGRLWPGQSAIGRVLRVSEPARRSEYRVVGVAPDLVYEELGEETEQSRLVFYAPYARLGYRTMAAIVRTDGDPAAVLPMARAAVRGVDPAFAAFDLLTMQDRRDATQWGERFLGRTFGVFAAMGLLLACLGAYGLTAHAAAQRTREIGVRLAIGARRADIIGLLVGRGARLTLAGIAAGLPLAALAAHAMRGLLFEGSPWEPWPWVSAPLLLTAAVLMASYLPARRASLADPVAALRTE